MLTVFFLLLPLAAFSGYYLAKRQFSEASGPAIWMPDYYVGLEYLLNEQTDKAVEVFVSLLDKEGQTVEASMALGNLFRRKGEVDKAIRVHQDLIARPNLGRKHRHLALLALGQDYASAGVYDRAEALLQELAQSDAQVCERSQMQLMRIYETEKEWQKAIAVAENLQSKTMRYMGREIAQYYCELATVAQRHGDLAQAIAWLKKATHHDKQCARMSILLGDIEYGAGRYKAALKQYKRVAQQAADFIPLVLEKLIQTFEQLGAPQALDHHLEHWMTAYPSVHVTLALANRLQQKGKHEQAIAFITHYLRAHPSILGLNHLVSFHLLEREAPRTDLLEIQSLVAKILAHKPIYQCEACGLSAKIMHWQCPSCKIWGLVKPMDTTAERQENTLSTMDSTAPCQ